MESAAPRSLRTFHAGWPGLALGTSGIAIAGLVDPIDGTDLDKHFGIVVAAVAVLATMVMVGVTVARALRHGDALRDDLRDPVLGAMLGTAPASLIVLALVVAQLGILDVIGAELASTTALVLIAAGLVASLLLGMAFFHGVIAHHELPVGMITGVWFIPVVVLVIVPSAIVRVLRLTDVLPQEAAIALSIASWGAGMLLFVFLGAVVAWRLITLAPPPAQMVASWFIWLAPASAGALGLIASTRMLALIAPDEVVALDLAARLVATSMWGFAAWWLVFSVLQVLRHRRAIGFHVGSWGFTFPLGAFVALTAELGHIWDAGVFGVIATIGWVAAMVLWALLLVLSVRYWTTRA
jgi:C4-dicarboxylate transporter/malic acid transport protein